MFSKKWAFILLVCISVYTSACKLNSLNDPIIISLVDKEFALELWQNLQSPTNSLEIRFETIDDENCLNSSILSSYRNHSDNLSLTIFEILQPENCDPGTAPAKGVESIHSITEYINYPLQIELQEVVNNTGSLTMTNTYYEVDMSDSNGINWKRTKLFRIPQDALWGYITYNGEEQLLTANDFIQTLQNEATTIPFNRGIGYYGHFELSSTNEITVKEAPEGEDSKVFLQSYNGSIENLEGLISTFRDTAPEGMELHVFDGKGKIWE